MTATIHHISDKATPAATAASRNPFARFLQARGLILASVVAQAERTGSSLVDAIVTYGLLPERDAYEALAASMNLPFIDLTGVVPSALALQLVPERVARKHTILPLAENNRTITYASAASLSLETDRDIAFASGRRPSLMVASRAQILAALNLAYSGQQDIEHLIDRIRRIGPAQPEPSPGARSDSPVIELCNRVLAAAIAAGASDIHVEPGVDGAVVRYRVCGILEHLLTLPAAAVESLTNRFKILASTDITTKRKPQDGAFRVTVEGRTVDVRLSALPTTHGEKLVMRVIDGATSLVTFDALGYDAAASATIRSALSKPDGLVLVTGPTGSGKTTALYAALQYLRTGHVNIVTVEDPVERYLEGVTQIPVNSRAGNGFAGVLRSVMRQDPNIIMVGEIRDPEVAEIVGQAAYTGHLVLSTLHTTDAASAITRLLNLGLPPFKVAESLNAVVAQRLVRKLCPHCAHPHDAAAARLRALAGASAAASPGPGCERCRQSGYLGRMAIPEILVPNDALRCAIRDGAGVSEIRAAMRAAGCASMRQTALALVAQGVTSLEEVDRVISNHDVEQGTAAEPARADTAAPRGGAGKLRVLVTDDDRMIRMLVRMLLENDGYEVVEAENGAAAVQLARRQPPDLMLCDLMMPEMNGFETIEQMRRDVRLAALPIIVLTAEKDGGVERRVLELGADDYLVKPFEADVLTSRVRAMFRRLGRTAAA